MKLSAKNPCLRVAAKRLFYSFAYYFLFPFLNKSAHILRSHDYGGYANNSSTEDLIKSFAPLPANPSIISIKEASLYNLNSPGSKLLNTFVIAILIGDIDQKNS